MLPVFGHARISDPSAPVSWSVSNARTAYAATLNAVFPTTTPAGPAPVIPGPWVTPPGPRSNLLGCATPGATERSTARTALRPRARIEHGHGARATRRHVGAVRTRRAHDRHDLLWRQRHAGILHLRPIGAVTGHLHDDGGGARGADRCQHEGRDGFGDDHIRRRPCGGYRGGRERAARARLGCRT